MTLQGPGWTRVVAAVTLFTAAVATGCSPTVENRGHIPDSEAVAEIELGAHTPEDVLDILGTPSSISTFDKRTWFYISETTETIAFFDPDVMERQVLVVSFGDDGYVSSIRALDKNDGADIDPVGRSTPTAGRNITILEQMFGNIGRFSGRESTK